MTATSRNRHRAARIAVLVASVLLGTGAAGVATADELAPAAVSEETTTIVAPDPVDEPGPAAEPAPDVPDPVIDEPEPVPEVVDVAEVPEADPPPEPVVADDTGTDTAPVPPVGSAVDEEAAAPVDDTDTPATDAPATDAPQPPAPEAAVPAEHEVGHDGPELTVNGQPFKGGGDPKLEGCTLTLGATGLDDADHSVSGAIRVVEPSGKATLVVVDDTFSGTSWTDSWDLTDLVTPYVQKPNGYRIRVDLAIDGGATSTSRPFWLACGAAQEGNPYVIVFEKVWEQADGTRLDGPPADLPDDWSLRATSKLGSAVCTYDEDVLACVYENKGGHEGATDGLYVPGGEKHMYTVSETGLPDGWDVVSGVGEFSAREECGGDDSHHEDDHGAVTRSEGGDREPCTHTVVDRQRPLPTTTTTTTAPTTSTTAGTSETTAPTTDGDVEGVTVSSVPPGSELARTGTDGQGLLTAGLVLLFSGALLVSFRRRLDRGPAA